MLTAVAFLPVGLLHAQTHISPNTPYGVPGSGLPAEWTGGRIHTLLMDPTNNATLYAASTTAGVWKSTDAGHSWFQASMGIKNPFMPFRNEVMALDNNNPKRLLLATEGDGRWQITSTKAEPAHKTGSRPRGTMRPYSRRQGNPRKSGCAGRRNWRLDGRHIAEGAMRYYELHGRPRDQAQEIRWFKPGEPTQEVLL